MLNIKYFNKISFGKMSATEIQAKKCWFYKYFLFSSQWCLILKDTHSFIFFLVEHISLIFVKFILGHNNNYCSLYTCNWYWEGTFQLPVIIHCTYSVLTYSHLSDNGSSGWKKKMQTSLHSMQSSDESFQFWFYNKNAICQYLLKCTQNQGTRI